MRTAVDTSGRLTPDFSRQALTQLLDEASQLAALARTATNQNQPSDWVQLSAVSIRIHAVLILLSRPGAALIIEEIIEVVQYLSDAQNELSEGNAHTLLNAVDVFTDYLSYLQWPGATDSVLSAMPVLNECRALRDANLLSENLLLAAGIQLPDVTQLAVPSTNELARFTDQIIVSRQPLIRALLDWYNAADSAAAMKELAVLLTDLANVNQAPTQLQPLVLLFNSAAVVAESIAAGELQTTLLLKHQFAQFERLLQRWATLSAADFPLQAVLSPDTVFRNFLYTIATEKLTSGKAVNLRKDFDLELFSLKNDAALKQAFVPSKISTALGQSVRDSVSHEIESLQRWLSQAASDPSHSEALGLRTRLSQLEPALLMLDEHRALAHLVAINSGLATMARDAAGNTREQRLDIAQATIRFRRSLDRQHQLPATELSQFTQAFDTPGHLAGSVVTLEEHPQHRLLSQAQQQLQSIEHNLERLFSNSSNAIPDKNQQTTLFAARQSLEELEQVLQILPLPEVSPLLKGMRSFLDYCAVQWPGMQSKRQFAELLVSVDYYMASVLSPHDAASQLLMNAEIIMQQLEHSVTAEMGAEADGITSELDETQVIAISGDALASLIDVSLDQMAVVGDQLLELNKPSSQGNQAEATQTLLVSWETLFVAAQQHAAPDLLKLSKANVGLISRLVAQQASVLDSMPLLEESHAVLPQLMDQHQGHSDHIVGFSKLIDALDAQTYSPNNTVKPTDVAASLDELQVAEFDASDLVQIVDSDFPEPDRQHTDPQQTDRLTSLRQERKTKTNDHDSTLQHVFFLECQGHIDALRGALKTAAEQPNERTAALPTPGVLRALHTLTGSAQTVGEACIIVLAQPLQKVALQRQRHGHVFNADETILVQQVVDALQARLDALKNGSNAATILVDIEQAIAEFAELVVSEPPVFALETRTLEQRLSASLKGVFVEEATDLLEQMRTSIDQHNSGSIELLSLLHDLKSPVHTLKGSARMAGFAEFATRVHDLEPLLDAGRQADVTRIEQEFALLQPMLLSQSLPASLPLSKARSALPETMVAGSPLSSEENITVSESGFAKMMSLATQASVSQAKLGEQLLKLNEIYRDLDSSTQRLRKQVHKTSRQPTAAEQEMLADLDAVRTSLASTLQSAESEHLQGSRADAELQQSLIRAQLVQFGACQTRLERAAHDSASLLGVTLSMQCSGSAINLDRSLYRQLLGPLEHLVRNAVAHGIEPAKDRLANQKPAQGKITVEADLDGNDLVITVKDDGAGIDIERLNNARVAAGLSQLETGQALRDALCEPGFSTREEADEVSGRGMGLAVVDQLALSLGGTLQIASVPGAGTTISLRLPQKVIVNQVVLVRCGHAHYAIPVKHVHTVLAELEGSQATHEFNGRQYTAYRLSSMLGTLDSPDTIPSLFIRDKGRAHACILAQAGDSHIALDVDAVVGYREVIAQPIGPQLMGLKRFKGGCVLADGAAVLILDMPRLMQIMSVKILQQTAQQARPMPVALVVDDSITMRVAAEHFLEEQGIHSRMARDGIEALSMLQQQLPDVLLLDIDMPRLNGLELLQHLRQLYPEHRLPIVMISTRNGEAEREKARALGASHFIGKPYHAADLHRALTELGILKAATSSI
ncbi:MAG: response regulator [Granulosicoccaceae bacterium]